MPAPPTKSSKQTPLAPGILLGVQRIVNKAGLCLKVGSGARQHFTQPTHLRLPATSKGLCLRFASLYQLVLLILYRVRRIVEFQGLDEANFGQCARHPESKLFALPLRVVSRPSTLLNSSQNPRALTKYLYSPHF